MPLSGVLTAQAVGGWRIALLVALAAAAAGVTWWGLAPRIALQEERAGTAERALGEAQALVALQADVLASQQQLLGDLADIERRMQQLSQTVTRNASAQARALEELKRNDQAIADYLAGPVPGALGRLYERPETTDPGAYRAPDGVQPGAVPCRLPARGPILVNDGWRQALDEADSALLSCAGQVLACMERQALQRKSE